MRLMQQATQAATLAASAAERLRFVDGKLASGTSSGNVLLTGGGRAAQDMLAASQLLNTLGNSAGQLGSALPAGLGRSMAAVGNAIGNIQGSANRILNSVAAGQSQYTKVTGAIAKANDALQQAFNTSSQQLAAADTAAKVLPIALSPTASPYRLSPLPIGGRASAANAHLLIMTTQAGETYYFNLTTAGFDSLKRQTAYNIASQERLTRRPALQAVSKGGDNITLSGVVFGAADLGAGRPGIGQLNQLRKIGQAMLPVTLTTGYGEVLNKWYLVKIDEEQAGLMDNGAPRKQSFTLEFQRYGEDYQNV